MVDDLLAKATALDPKARSTDAKAFWTRLREVQQQQPRAADPLAATAIDADSAAAIARVRAMTAGGVPQSDKGTMLMAQAPPHPEPAPAAAPAQEGPLAGTKPIAIASPLASSLGGNMKSPVAHVQPRTAAMPVVASPAPLAAPQQPITTPPPPQQQVVDLVPAGGQKSNTLIIVIIVVVIALVALVAVVMMLKGKS
jgi:hypothetical protein